MVSGSKNMAAPNGASVRLDEWPAVIQNGEEGKIIIVAIKVHIFAPSPPFYCVALEKRAECLFK